MIPPTMATKKENTPGITRVFVSQAMTTPSMTATTSVAPVDIPMSAVRFLSKPKLLMMVLLFLLC